MPLRVDVTEAPGLEAFLELDEEPSQAELEPVLNDFLASRGVGESKIEDALKDTMQTHKEATGQAFGWWPPIRDWWLGEKHEVIGTERHTIELATYWLTLPDVDGAKVSVSASTTSSDEVAASLKIAGIGGGPTITLELKEGVEFDTTAPERASLTATGTFEKVKATRLGEPIGTYVRLASIDRDNFDWELQSAKPPDPKGLGAPTASQGFKLAQSKASASKVLNIASGTTWKLGAEVDLKNLGLSASLGAQVSYKREVEYKYVLPKGRDYVAARYSSFPAYIWSLSG